MNPPEVIIHQPTKLDVLCGRSPADRAHAGNLRLETCIELHKSQYLSASKSEKSKIIKKIVTAIETQGGRFLKRKLSDGTFVALPPRNAREKVGLAMREFIDGGDHGKAAKKKKGSSKKKASVEKKIVSEQNLTTLSHPAKGLQQSLPNVEISADPLSFLRSVSESEVSDASSSPILSPKVLGSDSNISDFPTLQDPMEDINSFLGTIDDNCLQEFFMDHTV